MDQASTPGFEQFRAAGDEAIARFDWPAACDAFEQASALQEDPYVLEWLGYARRMRNEEAGTIAATERAFALYRAAGDRHGAIRTALGLADDYLSSRDEMAVGLGWLGRARRLGADLGPCLESGLLAYWQGCASLYSDDPGAALRSAEEAIEIGQACNCTDVVALGLALRGSVLACSGETGEGMPLLDEALACVVSGEVTDPINIVTACCHLMDACSQVRDFVRARQWAGNLKRLFDQANLPVYFSMCRPNYAQLLIWSGDWESAESELEIALDDFRVERQVLAGESRTRLAELRIRQGRLEEAAELLAKTPDHLAWIHLAVARQDWASAIAAGERALRRLLPESAAVRAAAFEAVIPAYIAAGDLDRADAAIDELRTLAIRLQTPGFRGAVLLSEGLAARAKGDYGLARARLEDAVDTYERAGGMYDAARTRLELASLLAAMHDPGATVEASNALAALRTVGAGRLAEQAESLLRSLAVPPSELPSGPSLSPREAEILGLVARGMSNLEIADGLVLSIRTVERHISNIYAKLGLDGPGARAAATAHAIAQGLHTVRT